MLEIVLALTLHSVKAELVARYPAYRQQIEQVKPPSVKYIKHLRFSWKHLAFIKADCNMFRNPQIIITLDKNPAETDFRRRHEFTHAVIFGAGLPDSEHNRIDKR